MDTLSSITTNTVQNSGFAQAPPPKINNDSEAPVSTVANTTPATQTKAPEQGNSQKVADAVKDINSFFQMTERSLEFNVDKTSGRVVMQIRDSKTHELISQIPGEDVIKLAKRLDEVTGLLFKAQA